MWQGVAIGQLGAVALSITHGLATLFRDCQHDALMHHILYNMVTSRPMQPSSLIWLIWELTPHATSLSNPQPSHQPPPPPPVN